MATGFVNEQWCPATFSLRLRTCSHQDESQDEAENIFNHVKIYKPFIVDPIGDDKQYTGPVLHFGQTKSFADVLDPFSRVQSRIGTEGRKGSNDSY